MSIIMAMNALNVTPIAFLVMVLFQQTVLLVLLPRFLLTKHAFLLLHVQQVLNQTTFMSA